MGFVIEQTRTQLQRMLHAEYGVLKITVEYIKIELQPSDSLLDIAVKEATALAATDACIALLRDNEEMQGEMFKIESARQLLHGKSKFLEWVRELLSHCTQVCDPPP